MKKNLLFLFTCVLLLMITNKLQGQCANNIIDNAGFESGVDSAWWNWHDNSPTAYAFSTSDDAFMGDSSAKISVLIDTDSIAGGQGGEYNSRPQMNAITGGEFYEISFAAKSTEPNTSMSIFVKDENDSWVLLHSDFVTVGTSWTMVSTLFQADMTRPDVHIEIKVYNGDFHVPYDVWIDEVSMCEVDIKTNTCPDNLVSNPGFEEGISTDWGNWHGNNPMGYAFETSTDAYLGDSSALIRVLMDSDLLSGPGEYNSRPQTQAIVDSQNYKISLWGKSTEPNTTITVWVKDEFDGWTSIHTDDLVVDTTWTEVSTVFKADKNRADIHIELKVFNPDFHTPYDVWIDEVAICTTTEEPGGGGDEPNLPVFGSATVVTTCSNDIGQGNNGFELPNDTLGWDLWDGDDMAVLSDFVLDPLLPHSGLNSVRIDINENHDVAEFHHRFGDRIALTNGTDYTLTTWMRADIPQGDTVHVLARLVRDTDWSAQLVVDFLVTENTWLNFSKTATADDDWTNAFVEFKTTRWTGFTDAYSIWFDDVQVCTADSAMTTAIQELEALGLDFVLFPNPVSANEPLSLNVVSREYLKDASIKMVDMMGRTVWTNQVDIQYGSQDISIPTEGMNSGLYIVHVEHQGYVVNLKLQVVK